MGYRNIMHQILGVWDHHSCGKHQGTHTCIAFPVHAQCIAHNAGVYALRISVSGICHTHEVEHLPGQS